MQDCIEFSQLIDNQEVYFYSRMNGKQLRELRAQKKISQTELSKISGISQPTISRIEATDDEIEKVSVNSILTKIFNIEENSGKSTPRLEAEPLYIAADPFDYDEKGGKFQDLGNGMIRFVIPIIPIKAQAGYLRGYGDPEFYEGLSTTTLEVYKEYRGHYLAFEVKGDSMIPTDPGLFQYMILPGWKAIARELPRHQWQYKLHIHNTDAWIIVHNTKGILIKSIISHDVDNAKITIHSLNPAYEDEVLELNDIAQIFSVQQYIVNAK